MNKSLLVFVFFIFSVVPVFSQTSAPESDFQVWNESTVTVPLIKTKDSNGKDVEKLDVFFNGVIRFGNNVQNASDRRLGFGFNYKINKYLTFTPAYLYVAAQPAKNGRIDYESRLRFSLTAEKKFSKFTIRDRNMIEHRIRNSRSDSTRYRNRFQFLYPVKKDGKELFTPYVYDEVYYDFTEKEFTRNDISAGITKKFNDNFSADFFYLFRNSKGSTLKYVNAVGVNLKFKID